jgi:hypothetical protein
MMTCACPAWELATDTYLLKLQPMENNVLCTIGNFSSCTSIRDFHIAFNLPYVYDYTTKLFRKEAEVKQNHENDLVRGIGQGEARRSKFKRLKLGGRLTYDRSSDLSCRCSIRYLR